MSGRLHAFVVAYDIADDRRRDRVADLLLSYGERVQASVFMVGASAASIVRMKEQLGDLINHKEDSIIVCDLGHYDTHESKCSYIGRHIESGLQRDCMII